MVSPRTQSYLLGTSFADGQGAGAITPDHVRDLIMTTVTTTVVSVAQYGAVGYPTNDTTAFTNALTDLNSAGGGVLVIPMGAYLVDPFTVPSNVAIIGASEGPFNSFSSPATTIRAPTLLVNSTATEFITMNFNSKLKNVTIYYPGQVAPTSATPTSYPATITIPYNNNGAVHISGVTLVNSYKGIFVGSGLCILERLNLGCYFSDIEIDGAADFTILRDIKIEPFYDLYAGLTYPQTIDTYVMNNATGLVIRRADEVIGSNIGLFGRYIGISLLDTAVGATPYTSAYGLFTNVNLDSVAYGVYARSTNHVGGGVKFVNMDVTGNGTGIGTSGVAALAMIAGGSDTPVVLWNSGASWGSYSATKGLTGITTIGQSYISNVIGINPYGLISGVAFPATSTNWTNTYGFPIRAHVTTTTTFTAIGINATATGFTGNCSILLQPGDVFVAVYGGGSPAWTLFGC